MEPRTIVWRALPQWSQIGIETQKKNKKKGKNKNPKRGAARDRTYEIKFDLVYVLDSDGDAFSALHPSPLKRKSLGPSPLRVPVKQGHAPPRQKVHNQQPPVAATPSVFSRQPPHKSDKVSASLL
eukprot:jgi/Botrbrau1/20869/Bobra.0135s0004.1